MRRYEGLLRPQIRPAPWPSRWVCVSAEGEPIAVEDRSRLRATGLKQWRAVVLEMHGPVNRGREQHAGQSASGLWALLAQLCFRRGPTWVISPRALFDWTLLGFWERLLLGQLTIVPSGPARQRGGKDRGLTRAPGMCLTADPPSAALISVGEEGQTVQWVCAGNYGWKDMFIGESVPDVPARLASMVEAASGALSAHRLGGWCPTIGAMALRAWRSQYMGGCLYVSDSESERAALYAGASGGRVFCPARNVGPAAGYWIDGRALYACLSCENPLPTGRRSYRRGGLSRALAVGGIGAHCCARVSIANGGGCYPCHERGATSYPQGPFVTTLCGPELDHAIKRGVVSEIGECHEYRMGAPLKAFEEACYALRLAGEKAGQEAVSTLAKVMAVSLIGKLHAYDEVWEEVSPDYNDPICGDWMDLDETDRLVEHRATAGMVARKRRKGLAATAVPAVAAWVWSAGRVWLLDRMLTAGFEEVLYADTDGMVVTERGYDRLCQADLIRDNEWGQLRLIAGPVDVEVIGPKMLRIGDELIAAGRPKNQRGRDFADQGFWYRRPFQGGSGPYQKGVFEEEYIKKGKGG